MAGREPDLPLSMKDLLTSPLSPAIILLAAGVLLRAVHSPRNKSTLAVLITAPLLGAFLLVVWLRASTAPTYAIGWWPLVIPRLQVQWTLDGWNWLGAMLLLIVGASSAMLTWREPGKRSGAFHGLNLILLAAAMLTVTSDNLLVLSGAWVALDILLLARARGSRAQIDATPIWLVVGGSLLVLVSIGITSLSLASSSLSIARLPREALILLAVAAALRMAAYPLHLWLAPTGVPRDRGAQWLLSGVGLATGGWLLGRLLPLGLSAILADTGWVAVFTICLLAASLAAWSGRDQDRVALLASSRAVWIWLLVLLSPASAAREVVGWGLACTVISMTLVVVGQALNDQWRYRLPLALGILTLVGLPLTTGMAARAFIDGPSLVLWIALALADGLAVAAALTLLAASGQPKTGGSPVVRWDKAGRRLVVVWPWARLLVGVGVAMVPNLLWSIQPTRLSALADFNQALSFGRLLAQFGLSGLLAVGVSLAAGVGFYWVTLSPGRLSPRWHARLASAAGLTWAVNAAGWLLQWVERAWRNALLIVEGEGYLGWIVFLFLLALLVIKL